MAGLYIGRFQPFHLGHLDAIGQILERESLVIIAIGSAEDSGTEENPWTASERYMMIEAALKEDKIPRSRYIIIPVRDIHNEAKWVSHVESLVPTFHRVYSGSPIVKELFKKDGKYKVVNLKKRLKINATTIRKAIRSEKKNWGKYLPPAVITKLKQFKPIE